MIDRSLTYAARLQAERVEEAIEEAILNDYDGVDVHRPFHALEDAFHYSLEIQAWNHPAPDGDNGKVTERYTWDWFDNEELKRAIKEDRILELLNEE